MTRWLVLFALLGVPTVASCGVPTHYSCTDAGRSRLDTIAKTLSDVDSNGRAVAYDDCDSSGTTSVDAYVGTPDTAAALNVVGKVLDCPDTPASDLVDGVTVKCSTPVGPVAVLFEADPAYNQTAVTVTPVKPK